MRVLTVHNFYRSGAPSGENVAYQAERDLLASRGIEVAEFTRHSDTLAQWGALGALVGACATPWNPNAARNLRRHVRDFKPDVVHVHNTFPLISPAALWALRDLPPAVVMTVHNFRVACASAMLSRDGRPCTECIDRRSVRPALRYACYRNSRVATLPLAASIALHRALGTLRKCVDAFVTLTEFQKSLLVAAGLPADALFVKPNAYDVSIEPTAWHERPHRVLFVGRADPEKGLDVLLEAWHLWGEAAPLLEVVGDGPELARMRGYVQAHGLTDRVVMRGALPFEATQRLVGASRLLIVPSRVFEGYPMVVREAFAFGVPVAASDIGSLQHIVDEAQVGRRFPPGDPLGLLGVVRAMWTDQAALEALGRGARHRYEEMLAPGPNLRLLEMVYAAARANKAARRA